MGTHDSIMGEFPEGVYASFVAKQEKAEESVPEGSPDPDAVDEVTPEEGVKRKRTVMKKRMVDGKEIVESFIEDLDEDTIQMTKKADENDAADEKLIKELKEEMEKIDAVTKLKPYYGSMFNVFIAVMSAILNGLVMPVFGALLSFVLADLTMPKDYW